MDKVYLHERRPDGAVSTVGLYYSREEAAGIVRQLQDLPEKRGCEYSIVDVEPTKGRAEARAKPV